MPNVICFQCRKPGVHFKKKTSLTPAWYTCDRTNEIAAMLEEELMLSLYGPETD